ncbi:MAG: hypothetical protein AAF265_07015 [Pseudomonadota bacterium]
MKKLIVALLLLLLIAGLLIWQNLGDGSGSIPEDADYFDLLRDAQTQVRESPDHLPAQYARIVASDDPEALIQFLRDSFEILPPAAGWQAARNEMGLGTHAALRNGAGTPRELVELLRGGIETMGLTGQLVTVAAPIPMRSLEAPDPPKFKQPEINHRLLSTIFPEEMPETGPLERHPDLWNSVAEAVPTAQNTAVRIRLAQPDRLPSLLISMTDSENGESVQKLANLWERDADNSWSDAEWRRTGSDVRPGSTLKLSLHMKTTDNQWHNMPVLAETALNAHDIAGARLSVGFSPVLSDAGSRHTTRPSDVRTFLPYIKVEGGNPDLNEEQRRIVGTAFTLSGDTIERDDESQTIDIGRHTLSSGGVPETVTDVQIRDIETERWPWLEVSFDPLDAGSNVVNGLAPDSITAIINDQPAALSLTANQRPPVRIVFLIDGSTSVAPQYRAAKLGDFVREMADRISEQYPGAQFMVMGDYGIVPTPKWSKDAAVVSDAAARMGLTANRMWTSVVGAGTLEPDAIIYFTDGNDVEFRTTGFDPTLEELPEDLQAKLASAPITFTLGGARPPEFLLGPAFEGIPRATGGQAFQITDHDAALNAISEALAEHIGAYRGYVRLPENVASRNAETVLQLGINNTTDASAFSAPDLAVQKEPSEIEGLYLKVTWNAAETSFHRLAGVAYEQSASNTDRRNAHLGLFGKYTLIADVGPVSPSIMLDEMITARLALEQVLEAETPEAAEDAFANVPVLPATAFSFTADLGDVRDYTPRLWIDADQRWMLDGQEVTVRRTDIVPLRLYSLSSDLDMAKSKTLKASALINDIEGSLFSDNDRKCIAPPLSINRDYQVSRDRRPQLDRLVAGYGTAMTYAYPTEGAIDCAIGINVNTGAGLFINDFGGAGITVGEVNARFEQVNNLLDAASEAGGSIEAWASLEQIKMDHLRMATISILTMEPPDLQGYYQDQACDALQGQVDSAIDGVVGSVGGDAATNALDHLREINDLAGQLGFGGLELSVPIPGCGG